MPRNHVVVDDYVYEQAAFLAYRSAGETSTRDKAKMKHILQKAIVNELTDTQRLCLIEHYINGKKMKDIAKMLSLNPSTVSRHISRAKEKLRHIASYY